MMLGKFFSIVLTVATLSVSFISQANALSASNSIVVSSAASQMVSRAVSGKEVFSEKRAARLEVIADDAAIFIMNEGTGASRLLGLMMEKMRASDDIRQMNEQVTDLELARAILNRAEVEIQ